MKKIIFFFVLMSCAGRNNDWDSGAQKSSNYLDLDANDKIIGGDWESDNRPDFLWVKYRPANFSGTLWRLGELLND